MFCLRNEFLGLTMCKCFVKVGKFLAIISLNAVSSLFLFLYYNNMKVRSLCQYSVQYSIQIEWLLMVEFTDSVVHLYSVIPPRDFTSMIIFFNTISVVSLWCSFKLRQCRFLYLFRRQNLNTYFRSTFSSPCGPDWPQLTLMLLPQPAKCWK